MLPDAKNRFSAVVEAALAGEPQRVARRGRWMGVVISAAECEPQDDEPFERIGLTPREFPCT